MFVHVGRNTVHGKADHPEYSEKNYQENGIEVIYQAEDECFYRSPLRLGNQFLR